MAVSHEEVALARKNVLDSGESVRDHRRRLHAVPRGHAAEVEGLLDVRLVPHPAGDAGGLLRRVGKQVPHAALVQFREGARSGRRPESRPEAVRRMARGAELDRVQRLRQPAADIVAERDRAKERGAAGALAFRHGERRSDDPAARVRLRGRMRIVGLVGVAEHAVRERGIGRGRHGAAAHDRGLLRAALRLRERDRLFSRREARAGQHRGERVEQVMLGLLLHRGRERPAQRPGDIGAQGLHDRGNLRSGSQTFLLDLVRHFK